MIEDLNDVDNLHLEYIRSFKLNIAMLEAFLKQMKDWIILLNGKRNTPAKRFSMMK